MRNIFLWILKWLSWFITVEGLLITVLPLSLIVEGKYIGLLLGLVLINFLIFTIISRKKGLKHFVFYPIHPLIVKFYIKVSKIKVDKFPKGKNYFVIHAGLYGVIFSKFKRKIGIVASNANYDIENIKEINIPKNSVMIGNTFINIALRKEENIKQNFGYQKIEGKLLRSFKSSKKVNYLYLINN